MNDRSEPTLGELLAGFASADDVRAARAFEGLAVLTRRGLHSYLRGRLHSQEAREDVIQEVLRRIWIRRGQFENQGTAAWWSLVRLVAEQCRVDLVRKIGAEIAWDEYELAEIPSGELVVMEALLEDLDDRQALYRAADELWLGFDPALSERDRARRVLAAHLFFSKRLGWDQICDLLNRNSRDAPVTRAQLDGWLIAASTIRALAFRSLYRDNTRLTCHLLGLGDDDPGELLQIARMAASGDQTQPPPAGWTWDEVRIILWRYREAERHDRILAKERCTLNKQELKLLLDRCVGMFPFLGNMEQLISDLSRWPEARKELAAAGVWQRLVFEYYGQDSPNHQDIFDRTAAPAALAPYHLTLGMLNVWLSNGRLAAKLASFVQNGRNTI
jgi:DNA-directed RNA polymerase specialized sigma24 family protein